MEDKSGLKDFIELVKRVLARHGYKVSIEESNMLDSYMDSPKSISEIKDELNDFVKEKLDTLVINQGEGDFRQNFNYHTHTFRSGHSQFVSDEEMLEAAKNMGITMLGFTEHIPNPPLILPDENKRMLFSEKEEYVRSINELKSSHPEMKILVGYEAEFDPMKEGFLGELREEVDYMILGQHFVINGLGRINPETPEYPLIYAKMVCMGIESGLFDIVAHPDFFMRYRDKIKSKEDKKKFEENAIIASRMICEAARDMGIPIEINLSQASSNRVLSDGCYHYPHPLFWREAAKIEGLKVIRGVDAHKPKAFKRAGTAEELVIDIERMVKDKIIYENYDPVEARKNNKKLQEAYKKHQESALPFETNMEDYVISQIESNIDKDLRPEESAVEVDNYLVSSIENCEFQAGEKRHALNEEILGITEKGDLSNPEVKRKLDRKRKTRNEEIEMVLSNQKSMLNKLRKMGLKMAKNGLIMKQENANYDIERIKTYKLGSSSEGFVSIILISIVTIIAGLLIIAILYSLYK